MTPRITSALIFGALFLVAPTAWAQADSGSARRSATLLTGLSAFSIPEDCEADAKYAVDACIGSIRCPGLEESIFVEGTSYGPPFPLEGEHVAGSEEIDGLLLVWGIDVKNTLFCATVAHPKRLEPAKYITSIFCAPTTDHPARERILRIARTHRFASGMACGVEE